VLSADTVAAAEMRGDNARKDPGHFRKLELSPASKIHKPIQQLRREPIVNSSRIAQFVWHSNIKRPKMAAGCNYF
jgi:cell division protein YceG involved in septum cleavage